MSTCTDDEPSQKHPFSRFLNFLSALLFYFTFYFCKCECENPMHPDTKTLKLEVIISNVQFDKMHRWLRACVPMVSAVYKTLSSLARVLLMHLFVCIHSVYCQDLALLIGWLISIWSFVILYCEHVFLRTRDISASRETLVKKLWAL